MWYLLISEVPFLYSLFDWKLVSLERRLQLCRATRGQMKLADLAHQEMQRCKTMRQALFTFLTIFTEIDVLLQYAAVVLPTLDHKPSLALAALLDQSRSFFQEATAHARKMVHDQGALPIVDAVKIDADNHIIDTFSMPLLPIESHEDSERFFALMGQLTAWQQGLQAFWSEQGGPRDAQRDKLKQTKAPGKPV